MGVQYPSEVVPKHQGGILKRVPRGSQKSLIFLTASLPGIPTSAESTSIEEESVAEVVAIHY